MPGYVYLPSQTETSKFNYWSITSYNWTHHFRAPMPVLFFLFSSFNLLCFGLLDGDWAVSLTLSNRHAVADEHDATSCIGADNVTFWGSRGTPSSSSSGSMSSSSIVSMLVRTSCLLILTTWLDNPGESAREWLVVDRVCESWLDAERCIVDVMVTSREACEKRKSARIEQIWSIL